MKKIILVISCFTLVLTACNEQNKDSKEVAEETNEVKFDTSNVEKDAEFAVAAADGGMMEVTLGNLASTNATSQQVKDFGAMMVKDHTAGNEELKTLASQKNITLPSALSEKKQKNVDVVSKLKGADFDKEYISFMVDDHKEDIDEFEEHAKDGNDPELKKWASGKIATLQHHLQSAESIKQGLK